MQNHQIPRLWFDRNFAMSALNDCTVDCDCDCACPAPTFWASRPVLVDDRIYQQAAFQAQAVGDGLFGLMGADCYYVVANQSVLDFLDDFKNPLSAVSVVNTYQNSWGKDRVATLFQDLTCLGYLRPLEKASNENYPARQLTAWIQVTDRCNLHCQYCYIQKRNQNLDVSVGKEIIDSLLRSARAHGIERLKLKYAGGEPLLNFPTLRDVHQYALQESDRQGILVEGIVLSNGTKISTTVLQQLQALNLHLMISLDTLAQSADVRGASYQAQRAIELAIQNNLIPTVSVTISQATLKTLPFLMEWLVDRNIRISLNFYRPHAAMHQPDELTLIPNELIDAMLAAYNVIALHQPRQSWLNGLLDRVNLTGARNVPCGVGQDYLVFDTDGNASKCHMLMSEKVTNCRVPDVLAIVQSDKLGIQNPPVIQKTDCKDCRWSMWCGGCCPTLARGTGGKSPFCSVYQALFPRLIELEATRLVGQEIY